MAERDPYKYEEHKFERRVAGKLFCSNCGLVSGNNAFTTWAVRMGCNNRDHPSYDNKRYDLTKLPF